MTDDLRRLEADVTACRRCPRLVAWREEVATTKRRAFARETYWGRPVPGFGDPLARLLLVGLAPAAHGANRTGRVFTGDRSGDFLFSALWRAGRASQASSVHAGDPLVLKDTYITSAVRCAPPKNKPLAEELTRCEAHLARELSLLPRLAVIVCLGKIAWDATCRTLQDKGAPAGRAPFGHGAEVALPAPWPTLVGAYHPSQQNTQTGRLTPPMYDALFGRVADLVD